MSPEGLNSAFQATMTSVRAAGQQDNATVIIDTLMENLVAEYPDMDLNTDYRDTSEWMFNNAGGAMGAMYIIHASVTE